MSNLKLVDSNDPVLRQVAEPVLENELEEIKKIASEMWQIMLQYKGIGLAAPQVGISKRFFIHGNEKKMEIVINPEVAHKSEETSTLTEGCLSFPGLAVNVERPESLTVKYYDSDWFEKTQTTGGLASRVFQHEIDHLDGICIDQKGIII